MMVNPLSEGMQIPFFKTKDESGNIHSSKTLAGRLVLLYFYPRDNTPGCIIQACELRDSFDELKELLVTILGISGCPLGSHQKFKSKYFLPFPLLLDEDHHIAKAFGVLGEKKFMGKTFNGIHRTSFLIDQQGKILKTYSQVKPKLHLKLIIGDLKEFVQKKDCGAKFP